MARVRDLRAVKGEHYQGRRWQAVWIGPDGRERTRTFPRKADAVRYGQRMEADRDRGSYVDPRTARMTVGEWAEAWLAGYATRRPSTVRQARVHLARITPAFGDMRLTQVRPSHVKAWTAQLRDEGLTESYVYALHARLTQVFADAVHDGMLARSPCSRRTSPGPAEQRAYVATTGQVWGLHDAMPERYRAAVLLGAFVGLRTGEACGLRVVDVDFMRGVVHPQVQYPAEPLKSERSRQPVPIPESLAHTLAAHLARWPSETTLLTERRGRQLPPWTLERAVRIARGTVDGLPAGFRFHDLRHYLASLLIASGSDVKTVQARLRHASAKTTLDTYSHLWPDRDQSTRAAVDAALRPSVGQESVSE